MIRTSCFCLLHLIFALSATPLAFSAAPLELRPRDHVCIVGNTLADRMQHSGWFESLLHTRFPEHDLTVRNLGFSGDELTVRLRSRDFGTPDEWLSRTQADVILAFFGFNESFAGPSGRGQFRSDLEAFIRHTQSQDYSGKGSPRLVIFSPIAQEAHADPNFPDPVPGNQRIKPYAVAMAEVARRNGVPFVDLFSLSLQAYAEAKASLTINGIHLSDAGYRAIAPAMFESLFGDAAPGMKGAVFERLRAAVNEKNAEWFKRYRTVDGYNVYGGRSHLKFDGVMNRDTMLREMEMRDVMTANRDRRVWAVARGGDLVVSDGNLPPPVEVDTNKPGGGPDGAHAFLTGEAAIERMKVPPGCEVNLFASEERFPALVNPVQMAFDTRGRLWVAAWPNYPERTPASKTGDSLLILEDVDGDGRADTCRPFLDNLNCPTGFQFYRDGVIVVQAPDVWFVRDTDGDGRGDWKERILNGLDSADSHHTANALALDPGGAIYLSDGVFHRTQVETALGPVRNQDAAIYRFVPRTAKFETYIPYGFANPHGRVFDYWGNDLVTDATGNHTYFGPAFSGRLDYPAKHAGLREFWRRPSRPCPGTGILSSRHFPEEFQGNFLNCNVIGFQGIFRVKVREEGSGLWGETLEPALVQSDDPNFRPTAVGVAPDGSVYFLDWHNPIIGHMQHHLRDPSRDHLHGRVYRIVHADRPLTQPARIAGESIPALLELLKSPEDDVRTRAKIELGARPTDEVIAAVREWVQRFDTGRIEDQHHLLEALWVHQWHNVIDEPLLRRLLLSPEPRARAAAVRVLCYWRDRVGQPLGLLRHAANDASPRVRLEAVRAASFFEGVEALEIAHEILKYETDYYLDYTFGETLRQLKRSSEDVFLPEDPQALSRAIERLTNEELLRAAPVEAVLVARLGRKGIDVNARNEALDQLATRRNRDRVTEAVEALHRLDRDGGDPMVVKDLALLLMVDPSALAPVRPDLRRLSRDADQRTVRLAAYAGIVAGDGQPDTFWRETAARPRERVALVDSIVLLVDPAARADFGPLLLQVLDDDDASQRLRHAALRALPLTGADHAPDNFRRLAERLRAGPDLTVAALAVMQLPREAWQAESAARAATAILEWAGNVPPARRTEQEYVEVVQTGMELAALLPARESARIRRALLELGVRVFAIKTVREEMRYDITRIVVEAGKPFEIIFENNDMMQHNLVVVRPGAREAVGKQAERMPPKPDRQGRVYVPKNKQILAATELLEPGQRTRLKLTAPQEPGTYEYVCTYPEHWMSMYGELIVVDDLEAYLARPARPAPTPARPSAGDHSDHR